MVHPALLRPSTATAPAAGKRQAERHSAPATLAAAKRLAHRLGLWGAAQYRPELHYMRGGRTAGAKSLAAN